MIPCMIRYAGKEFQDKPFIPIQNGVKTAQSFIFGTVCRYPHQTCKKENNLSSFRTHQY